MTSLASAVVMIAGLRGHFVYVIYFQFGGNDILQIYNVHQVKHRLNTTGMYIASTKVRKNLLFYHFMKMADTIINPKSVIIYDIVCGSGITPCIKTDLLIFG